MRSSDAGRSVVEHGSRNASTEIRNLRALLASLPGMAYRCWNEPAWPMQFVSDGSRALSGYAPGALVGGTPNWGDLIHADDRPQVWQAVQDALRRDRHFEIRYRITTVDKACKWVWERGTAVDSDGRGLLIEGFMTDITPLRRKEMQLKEQQDQLTRLDRLSTLGEMTAGIAHEINQPLTAISTYAQSCLRFMDPDNPKPDRLKEALGKLSEQAHRAGAVVERIREFARQRPSANELIDCNELIETVEELAEADARGRGIVIRTKLARDLRIVLCDPIQIQQVVLNLIRNAIDSMESSGFQGGNEVVLRTEKTDGGGVRIAVVDSGTGISDVVEKDLFRPFSTHKASGLGMGLSVSRSIVTAHGGQLDYYNNSRGGATFFLLLPPAPGESNDK